ncbi:MAG: hypothetical protein KDN22_03970 [Verrucomicrobiae bacterium]|nr:hypothetical protein [Verrucomicrobiae bacterium]
MKSSIPASLVAALVAIPLFLLSPLLAADGIDVQSARGALQTLSQTKGADYLGRVMMVEGRYGNHQPKAWRILALDPQKPGQLREFMVNGDRIDSERTLLAWKQGRRVPLREVMVDSVDAFLHADLAAKDAKVGFDRLDYQLVMPTDATEPLWLVTLVNKAGDAVGEVHVGARTGIVTRKAWPKPGAPALSLEPSEAVQKASAPVKQVNIEKKVKSTPAPTVANSSPGPDAASLKETSGQILEGARQGIIRTSGSVRDFLKKGLQEK